MFKTSFFAALGGLAAFAATAGSAQAQCGNCSYETVVVKHCEHFTPHHVVRRVVTEQIVPVVTYRKVRRVRYVRHTWYTRHVTWRAVPDGYDAYGYALGMRPYHNWRNLDGSYGLVYGR